MTEARASGGAVERWRTENLPVLLATAAAAFAAHGFLFSNEFFSHDAISYYAYAEWGMPFYASVGRFLIPLCEFCKGGVAAPWLIGLLFTLWTALSARAVTRLLSIHTAIGQALITALLCTNLAITLTGASYIYCMDEYALALFFSAAAAEWFCRDGRKAYWGLAPLILSLCLYQPYFTVSASLCLLWIIQQAAHGKSWKILIRKGGRCLGLLTVGFGVYYLLWLAVCALIGVDQRRALEALNGLGQIIPRIFQSYGQYFTFLLRASGVLGVFLPLVHVGLLILLVWRLWVLWKTMRGPVANRRFLLACIAVTPPAFCSACILIPDDAHALTTFAREFLYLLAVMVFDASAPVRKPAVQADGGQASSGQPDGKNHNQAKRPGGKKKSGGKNAGKNAVNSKPGNPKSVNSKPVNPKPASQKAGSGKNGKAPYGKGGKFSGVWEKLSAVWKKFDGLREKCGGIGKTFGGLWEKSGWIGEKCGAAWKNCVRVCKKRGGILRRHCGKAWERAIQFVHIWWRPALAGLLGLVLWHHVVFANQVYMKKDLEKNATLLLAARIVDRIEAVEGYVPGQTPVTFVGRLDRNAALNRTPAAFEGLAEYSGLWHSYAATYNLGRYLTNYLQYPLAWDQTLYYAGLEEVQSMPAFPAGDCAKLVDGALVVKLS